MPRDENQRRKTKKNQQKEKTKKYGKYTARHVRSKVQEMKSKPSKKDLEFETPTKNHSLSAVVFSNKEL